MTRRADYLAANRGRRQTTPGFILLVNDRRDGDPAPRIGITVSKKVGGAVIRNRMKRRFRALARELLPLHALAGADHVLIGRREGIERDFALLRAEMIKALAKARNPASVQPERGRRRSQGGGEAQEPRAARQKASARSAQTAEQAGQNPAEP